MTRSLQPTVTFKTPELLHFKTEPSIQRHKTAVSVQFGLAKNRGFGTGFDNRNNTSNVCIHIHYNSVENLHWQKPVSAGPV